VRLTLKNNTRVTNDEVSEADAKGEVTRSSVLIGLSTSSEINT